MQWLDPYLCGCGCFNHIQTLFLSMIHAYGPFNKFRMVCNNSLLIITQFSQTKCAFVKHTMWLIYSGLTLIYVAVAVITISKHYISLCYMPMVPSESLWWFVSTVYWLSSSFHTPEKSNRKNKIICSDLTVILCGCGFFNHIQTLCLSMIHAYGHWTSLGWFVTTVYWLSPSFHTPDVPVLSTPSD